MENLYEICKEFIQLSKYNDAAKGILESIYEEHAKIQKEKK